jgi:Zn-dependent peptidase ImmA (M78 family)
VKIFHPYGSKERLLEVFQRVNNVILTEAILPKEKKEEIIFELVKFVADKLGLGSDIPKIILSYDENVAQKMSSFGKCTPEIDEIRVVVINRNLADVCRTLVHELKHYDQYKKGTLNQNSNDTGSSEENEANAFAGIIMREFGKNNPIIFE